MSALLGMTAFRYGFRIGSSLMTELCGTSEAIYRCTLCETKFEAGVADDMDGGPPRCPQCGFFEAEPTAVEDCEAGEIVIRRTTKFR